MTDDTTGPMPVDDFMDRNGSEFFETDAAVFPNLNNEDSE